MEDGPQDGENLTPGDSTSGTVQGKKKKSGFVPK